MIRKAAAFAKKAHEGTFRKGTDIPYICHPLEAAVIVAEITDDQEVIAAALLHDVLEDTPVTRQELEATFGSRIAGLVELESEDKSKTWQERKQTTISHLQNAGREEKLLVLGDKLSNMRSTASAYLMTGDLVFERFHVTEKEKHAWYYGSVIEALAVFDGIPAYEELKQLYKFVFGG